MPPLDLDTLRQTVEKMTPGEWRYVGADNVFITTPQGQVVSAVHLQPRSHPPDVTTTQRDANAHGIVALRNAAPHLLDELAEARRTLQEFLDWGAMTASDRAYFERKFRALLPAPPED